MDFSLCSVVSVGGDGNVEAVTLLNLIPDEALKFFLFCDSLNLSGAEIFTA